MSKALALVAVLLIAGCTTVPAGLPIKGSSLATDPPKRTTSSQAVSGGQAVATATTRIDRSAITDSAVREVATAALAAVQEASIREAREYCGFILLSPTGQIQASPATPGTLAGCSFSVPRNADILLASYHTHGRYDRGYDNEVPSPGDMQGDFQSQIDGYISTPGGRLWHVDYETRTAYQLCRDCMVSDPNSPARESGPPVRTSYTLPQIFARTF